MTRLRRGIADPTSDRRGGVDRASGAILVTERVIELVDLVTPDASGVTDLMSNPMTKPNQRMNASGVMPQTQTGQQANQTKIPNQTPQASFLPRT